LAAKDFSCGDNVGATPGQKTQLGNGAIPYAGGQSNAHSLIFEKRHDIARGLACVFRVFKAGANSQIVGRNVHVVGFR